MNITKVLWTRRVRNGAGIAIVAATLGVAAVPVAAHAAQANYWSGSTGENVVRQTGSPKSLIGGGGWVVSTAVRLHVNNAAGAGYSLGNGYIDNTTAQLHISHPRYYPAYSNCWWDYLNGSSSTQIGLTCFTKD